MSPLIAALVFILQSLLYLYLVMLLLRFLVQAAGADYHNPIVQAIVKLTDPVLSWLRAVFKAMSLKRYDFASLIMGWVVAGLYVYLLTGLPALDSLNYLHLAIRAAFMLLNALLDLYFFIFIIIVIASWIGAAAHPALILLNQIAQPILQPFRQVIPPVSGLDFSMLAAILILIALQRHILPAAETALLL